MTWLGLHLAVLMCIQVLGARGPTMIIIRSRPPVTSFRGQYLFWWAARLKLSSRLAPEEEDMIWR